MITIIRIIFAGTFVLTVAAGIVLRAGRAPGAILAGSAAAAAIAGAVVLVESRLARVITGYRRAIIGGAIGGWFAGFLVRTLLLEVSACSALLDPFREAVIVLAFIWLGATAAVYATRAGISLPIDWKPRGASAGAAATNAVISITAVLWLFVGASVIYYAASTANKVYPPRVFLVPLAVLIAVSAAGLAAGVRLVRLAAVVVPVLLFALAMTAVTFAIASVGTSLNPWMRMDCQQAAVFLVWAYAGAAFLIED